MAAFQVADHRSASFVAPDWKQESKSETDLVAEAAARQKLGPAELTRRIATDLAAKEAAGQLSPREVETLEAILDFMEELQDDMEVTRREAEMELAEQRAR